MLTKDQIINACDRKIVSLMIEEWDGVIRIRELSAKQRIEYENMIMRDESDNDYSKSILRLISFSVVNDNDEPYFSEEDVSILLEKSYKVILRIFNEICVLNGMQKGSVEEAVENFDPAQANNLSSV